MRVLVIGSGAREHALIARLSSDRDVGELLCAPGNPGIARLARTSPVDPTDLDGLLTLAEREAIDFTVVGPELPLSSGIVDRFAAAGHLIFGPTAAAARLESSKAFAKALMARHGVPTARFRTCESAGEALDVIASGTFGWPLVLKADGLAAGKGVVIADDAASAEAAVRAAMHEHRFGAAGARLVVEECLTGQEVSFFVISDGLHAVPFGSAHDHKRIFDDDRGPNTGGMGAFAPSPLIDSGIEACIMRDIIQPVIEAMSAEGARFRGFLYAGLMLTPTGPHVIEFNVRLGDPEAQVILPMIAEPLLHPESAESGRVINGIERAEAMPGVCVYHAGTSMRDGRLVTAGGRVLTVVGQGRDFSEAIGRAYAGVQQISFDGMQYRRDIGRKALAYRE